MDYVEVQIAVPKKLQTRIERLGEQCGLTGDQMASAILVLAVAQEPAPDTESEETHS